MATREFFPRTEAELRASSTGRHDPEYLARRLISFMQNPDVSEVEKEYLKDFFCTDRERTVKVLPSRAEITAKLALIRPIFDAFVHPNNLSAWKKPKGFLFWHLAFLFHMPDEQLTAMANDIRMINNDLDDCLPFIKHLLHGFVLLPDWPDPNDSPRPNKVIQLRDIPQEETFYRDCHECLITGRKDGLRAFPIIPYGADGDAYALDALKQRWPLAKRVFGEDITRPLENQMFEYHHATLREWNHITLSTAVAEMLEQGILGLEPVDDDIDNIRVRAQWLILPGGNENRRYDDVLENLDENVVESMFSPLLDERNTGERREVNVQNGHLLVSGAVYKLHHRPLHRSLDRDVTLAALKMRWRLQALKFCAGATGLDLEDLRYYNPAVLDAILARGNRGQSG
ncbi:hypothetical protein NLG97_g5892 [Lecanicillium saksenae]|uniref:Uncharacterized protein n=1 Tax=Lecanicillium saksenae TaxID=468837 RepID=A0ACC1QRC7_9HYPO|nr:hypothetical protein NLG97_g5892 [Lecanicillium saksenae]